VEPGAKPEDGGVNPNAQGDPNTV
jgi:hypothetical protein